MRLWLDEQEETVERACAAGQGLGGAFAGAELRAYRLEVFRAELLPHLEAEVGALAAQVGQDGDVFGRAERELKRRAWPPVSGLLQEEPGLLADLVLEAGLAEGLMERLLGQAVSRHGPSARWALRRVERLELGETGARLFGQAVDLRPGLGNGSASRGPAVGPDGGEVDMAPDELESEEGGRKARKQRAHDVQKLGERLTKLEPRELESLDLPGELMEAVLLAQRIKAREGQRRQLQTIGRIMRGLDSAPIRAFFAERDRLREREVEGFKRIERWRQALMAGDPRAPQEILEICPGVDLDHLEELAAQARREAVENRPPRGSRSLFRYLRALFEQSDVG
jgi:ribosome-associated protein